jgi:hypothetical protein
MCILLKNGDHQDINLITKIGDTHFLCIYFLTENIQKYITLTYIFFIMRENSII